ncbi:agamous-like MADS-box protein AGL28 [Lolium rigidum]|uniref:agamous-like MADS-box protein AGL28 n=1 Tax=Lolium rigidum TaxID=89674 RepID=UPI001F5D61C9|nr:agamous-like MADS-box protein AGL28 [Lolium rigidum]
MPRRERRLGVMYIDNDKDRDVTFFKRRGGLYKGAADLSVLTGAKVAIVLEKDNGKMHSFGAPSTKPIVDAFLLGHPPTTPFTNGVTTSRIERLQGNVARLDMENMKEGKRNQLSIQRMKEIQDDKPGMEAKLLFSKEEDLSLEDLDRLFNDLSRVQDDIRRRLPPLHNGCNTNTKLFF